MPHGKYKTRRCDYENGLWIFPGYDPFHAYEAVYSNKTGKQVITYVIYSGGIQHVKEELDCGLYTYRIHSIYMKEFNAGQIFRRLHEKREAGEPFTEEDFAGLTLTPLMAGGYGKKDAIKEAIQLAKVSQEESAQRSIAMLYVLADKFLKGTELEEIKEVVAMTRLGQMLMEDGIEKGIQEGIQKGLERGRKEGLQEGIHEGAEQMAALMGKLLEEDRMDDLKQAAKDKEYREKLLKELKII